VRYPELPKPPDPPIKRFVVRYPEGGGGDRAGSRYMGAYPRPVKERHLCTGMPDLIPVKEVVGGDVVLVDRLLHQSQAQRVRIKRHVPRGIRRNCRDVVNTAQFHLSSFVNELCD
jgi:hypothetical protein